MINTLDSEESITSMCTLQEIYFQVLSTCFSPTNEQYSVLRNMIHTAINSQHVSQSDVLKEVQAAISVYYFQINGTPCITEVEPPIEDKKDQSTLTM